MAPEHSEAVSDAPSTSQLFRLPACLVAACFFKIGEQRLAKLV
ncbi:hypothetical protein [Haloplanus pelagicus]|jgi:hypothetical protein|nr:hypothetical protein [Haloplanus sp. HW8-1]